MGEAEGADGLGQQLPDPPDYVRLREACDRVRARAAAWLRSQGLGVGWCGVRVTWGDGGLTLESRHFVVQAEAHAWAGGQRDRPRTNAWCFAVQAPPHGGEVDGGA
jgi:hypothetical protein